MLISLMFMDFLAAQLYRMHFIKKTYENQARRARGRDQELRPALYERWCPAHFPLLIDSLASGVFSATQRFQSNNAWLGWG